MSIIGRIDYRLVYPVWTEGYFLKTMNSTIGKSFSNAWIHRIGIIENSTIGKSFFTEYVFVEIVDIDEVIDTDEWIFVLCI